MKTNRTPLALLTVIAALLIAACGGAVESPQTNTGATRNILAAETFLADIAQNVAGERATVNALIPMGVDPHGFEPTPQDVRKVAESTVLIVNGAGFEGFLSTLLTNAGGQRIVIEAASGLTSRAEREGEEAMGVHEDEADPGHESDPHFWLDPISVIKYVENIRDGLILADAAGRETYTANAAAYIVKLNELDRWATEQMQQVPAARRLLVTNHESFGYFADRYGLRIVGTVIPSVSTSASPSAKQLTQLVEAVRASGAPAVFLETGANPQLAEQLGRETGVKVVSGLLTHSITAADGPAPDYLSMMRYNVSTIVDALR